MIKKIYLIFSLLFLVYLIMPGPKQISDFKSLPSSDKSTLEGDTIQIPNVSAYFSNNYRNFVTSFYLENYLNKTWLPFPPLRLNHPPEYAWKVIKKHTGLDLKQGDFELKSNLIVLKTSPGYKNKIFIFKKDIIKDLEENSSLKNVDIR